MRKEEAFRIALKLVDKSNIAMVGSNGEDRYPNIEAMLKMKNEGLNRIWFSTNTSSKRVAQFRRNSKACVYFVDAVNYEGVMLVGEMNVRQDSESRKSLWQKGFERYYPLGVDDPDYCTLCFTALWGNVYHKLAVFLSLIVKLSSLRFHCAVGQCLS